jgi:hypothetical protein
LRPPRIFTTPPPGLLDFLYAGSRLNCLHCQDIEQDKDLVMDDIARSHSGLAHLAGSAPELVVGLACKQVGLDHSDYVMFPIAVAGDRANCEFGYHVLHCYIHAITFPPTAGTSSSKPHSGQNSITASKVSPFKIMVPHWTAVISAPQHGQVVIAGFSDENAGPYGLRPWPCVPLQARGRGQDTQLAARSGSVFVY